MAYRLRILPVVSKSIRLKMTLGVIFPLLFILGSFTLLEHSYHRKVLLQNLSSLSSITGKVIESNLYPAMLDSDFSEVQSILDSLNADNDFSTIYLINTKGKVIFSQHGESTGIVLDDHAPGCLPCHGLSEDKRPVSVVVETESGEHIFRSMHPIKNAPECSTCHDASQPVIGLLLTDIPLGPVESTLNADLRVNLAWWLGTILTTVIVVNLAMSRIVLKRLEGLAQTIRDFGQNRLNLRMKTGDLDEIGNLTNTFNEMGQRLEEEAGRNRELSSNVREQNDQRGLLLKRLITIQEDERKRVARELHDDLGQALSALLFQAKAMERLIPDNSKEALEQLNLTEDLITNTTDHMYDMIVALRPSILDELGLVVALQAQAERILKDTGIDFDLSVEGMSGRLSPTLESNIYRIFQEAINNVRRHAQAKHIWLSLICNDGWITGDIRDDGCGFDLQTIHLNGDDPCGLGLLSMQERAAMCCGKMDIISTPGQGTLIRIYLPIEENCD